MTGIGLFDKCYFLLKISSAGCLREDPDIKVAFLTDLDCFEILGRSCVLFISGYLIGEVGYKTNSGSLSR